LFTEDDEEPTRKFIWDLNDKYKKINLEVKILYYHALDITKYIQIGL